MKKSTLKTLTLTTAVTATVLGQNLVSAEEMVETPSTPSATNTEILREVTVTAEQVAGAKMAVDEAASKVASQEAVVAQAGTDARVAQVAEDKAIQDLATAQANANQATVQNIQDAEAEVAKAEQAEIDAQNQIQIAEKTVQEAKTKADVEKAEAEQAQTIADTAKAEAAKSKANLTALQSSQDGQVITKTQEAVKAAETDVTAKAVTVETAEANLETAKATDAQLVKNTNQAKTELDTAKSALAAFQESQKQAQSQVEQAKKEVEKAQLDINNSKADIAYSITVSLPEEVKQALLDIINFDAEAYTGIEIDYSKGSEYVIAQINEIREKVQPFYDEKDALFKKYGYDIASNNPVQVSFYGGADLVDPDKPTDEQILVANQFYIEMINAIRKELGLPEVYASSLLVDAAKIRATEYDKLNTAHSHVDTIIQNADKEVFGKVIGTGENLSLGTTHKVVDGKMTLSDYLQVLVDAISGYVFYDGGDERYGHMRSHLTSTALGLATYEEEALAFEGYIGLEDTHYVRTVIATYSNSNFGLREEEDELILSGKIDKLDQSSYQTAVKRLDEAKSNQLSAQSDLISATNQVAFAQSEVTKAQAKYDKLLATPYQVVDAEKAVNKAKNSLSEAQTKLKVAQGNLKMAENQASSLASDIAKAQSDYDNLLAKANNLQKIADSQKVEANLAQIELIKAQEELAKTKEAVIDAQTQVADSRDLVRALKVAGLNLIKAQQALEDAVKMSKDADKNLESEKAKLAELKATYNKVNDYYLTLKELYDLSLTNIVTELPDGTIIAIPDTTPTLEELPVYEFSQESPQSQPVVKNLVQMLQESTKKVTTAKSTLPAGVIITADGVKYSRIAKAKTLPNTGEKDSWMLSLSGLFALSGVISLKKRRH